MFRTSSGFVWAMVLVVLVMTFFTVSIDSASVQNVTIVGELDDRQLADLKRELDGMDVIASESGLLKQQLTALDWVRHVNVRKQWPAGIEVEVYPEYAIAYWNDDAWINKEGEVLVTDLLESGDLPHLYGPEGREFEVMTRYQQLQPMLGAHGYAIDALTLSERGSWSIETVNDVKVLLGKEDLMGRMERFLEVSSRLKAEGDTREIARMDARYANGIAVHFNSSELDIAEINKNAGEQNL